MPSESVTSINFCPLNENLLYVSYSSTGKSKTGILLFLPDEKNRGKRVCRIFSLFLDVAFRRRHLFIWHVLCRLETNGSRNVDFFSCNSFSCSSFYVNCDVSPDDKYVLTGSSASGVHIWDQANKLCHIYSSHNSEVSAVAWSKTNPSIFASASDDKSVRIWNIDRGIHHMLYFSEKRYFSHRKEPISASSAPNRPPSNDTKENSGNLHNQVAPQRSMKLKINQLRSFTGSTRRLNDTSTDAPVSSEDDIEGNYSSGELDEDDASLLDPSEVDQLESGGNSPLKTRNSDEDDSSPDFPDSEDEDSNGKDSDGDKFVKFIPRQKRRFFVEESPELDAKKAHKAMRDDFVSEEDKHKKAVQRKVAKERKMEEARKTALSKLLTKKQRPAESSSTEKSSKAKATTVTGPVPEGVVRFYDTATKTLVICPSL
ncbi:hypothetical protein MDAP_001325 [Mitosporidium daphniae]